MLKFEIFNREESGGISIRCITGEPSVRIVLQAVLEMRELYFDTDINVGIGVDDRDDTFNIIIRMPRNLKDDIVSIMKLGANCEKVMNSNRLHHGQN